MFNIVNAYTRGSQFEGLAAESSYRLQRVGGSILEMVQWLRGLIIRRRNGIERVSIEWVIVLLICLNLRDYDAHSFTCR